MPVLIPEPDLDIVVPTVDVLLEWLASTDPEGNPIEYMVEVYRTADFSGVPVGTSTWQSGTTFTVMGLTGLGATYYWRVKARDDKLAESAWSSGGDFSFIITGSCPFLYVRSGQGFAFESDVMTSARLGTRNAAGYKPPFPEDYYVLRTPLDLSSSEITMQLVGERIEVDYVDQVKLFAVLSPDDRVVYSEKPVLGVSTGFGLSALHTADVDPARPLSVTHVNTGEDIGDVTGDADGDFAILNDDANVGFDYQTIELDLGDVTAAPQVKLLVDGRTVYPSTPEGKARQRMFGAISRLEVKDASGAWVTVPSSVAALPPPAAFRRPFVLDITNVWVGPERRVRLTWLFKTYIDSIRVDTTADAPLDTVELPLLSADLHFYGLSGKTPGEIFEHVYGAVDTRPPAYFPGAYTRYGDVAPLLAAQDDKFVIMFGADEVTLSFNTQVMPGPGQRATLLLYSRGYYKDLAIDLPLTVEPLPFAAMSNYPYPAPEAYPSDDDHNAYRATYNTRVLP